MRKAPKYKDYEGEVYKVISIATHSETEEEVVVFFDSKSKSWVMPSDIFFGKIEVDGVEIRRFEPIT